MRDEVAKFLSDVEKACALIADASSSPSVKH